MARTKKKQRLTYIPGVTQINTPPRWKSMGKKRAIEETEVVAESSQAAAKRSRGNGSRDANEFRRRISFQIHAYCKSGQDDVSPLKDMLISMKALPKGTVTEAEKRNTIDGQAIQTTEIEKYINRLSRKGKKGIQLWKDFINKNFVTLTEEIKEKIKGNETSTASLTPEQQSTGSVSTFEDVDDKEFVRTISCSLESIVREDLPQDIRQEFFNRISQATTHATDYIIRYSLQILKIVLLFETSSFVLHENDRVALEPKTGPDPAYVLPAGYHFDPRFGQMPPPLPGDCLSNEIFTQEFDKLFNNSHLDRIHSEYFGKLGIREGTKDNRRIEKTIISALPITNKSDIEADPFIMKMALAKYKTYFLNMWSNNKAFYSLLNHLLLALLRVHLAPLREAKKRDYLDRQRDRQNARNVKQYASSIPVDDILLIGLSYHARKRLFKKERSQEESNQIKAMNDRPNADKMKQAREIHSATAIKDDQETELELQADANPTAAQELRNEEDSGNQTTTDLPSRRINTLKTTMRRIILEKTLETECEDRLKASLPDIDNNEVRENCAYCKTNFSIGSEA
ncbi:hypothetical protein BD408DRAFT_442320 [Parasitella parasitica]|nr:hypothetical protein BD408DRAFT_442320 [Parasitella parasitica]